MNKKFALLALIFWISIIIIFFSIIFTFAIENNFKIIEACKVIALQVQISILNIGIMSWLVCILLFAVRPLVFFPATVMTLTTLYVFGPFVGFMLSLLGELLSAVITFTIGKFFSDEFKLTKQSMIKPITPYFQKNAFLSVFVLRIVPLFPFDFVNYSAGILNINFKKYFYATALGIVPGLLVFVFLAYSIINQKFLPYAIITTATLIIFGIYLKKKYEVHA